MASTTVTVQFANDQTGKNIDVQVNTDGKDYQVSNLIHTAGSDLAFVTEIQLLAGRENVIVVVKANGQTLATINGNANNDAHITKTAVGDLTVEATKSA